MSPWLALQADLNRFKEQLPQAVWSSAPYRFTRLQYAAMAVGLVVLVYGGWGKYVIELDGEYVYPRYPFKNDVVYGPDRLYHLTVPDGGWAVLSSEILGSEGQLAIIRPDFSAYAIVDRHDDPNVTAAALLAAEQEDRTEGLEDPIVSRDAQQVDPETFCEFLHISSIGRTLLSIRTVIEVGVCQTPGGLIKIDGHSTEYYYSEELREENTPIRALVRSFRTVPPE